MRLPSYAQHRRLCEVDGWQDKDAASKKPKGDHHRYVKALPGGDTLFTRVSHEAGSYRSRDLWGHILRDQLRVTEDQFWAAVERGIPPERDLGEPEKPKGEPIPFALVQRLRHVVGLPEREIAAMTRSEAEAAWQRWLGSQGHPGER